MEYKERRLMEIVELRAKQDRLKLYLKSSDFKALNEYAKSHLIIKEYCLYQYIDILELILDDQQSGLGG